MLHESANLRAALDDDRTATLWLNGPGPNQFDSELLNEIETALDAIERSNAEVLILRSAKLAGFCSGIDPAAISTLASDAEAREFATLGQRVMNRLAESPLVTVAFLHGPVYGAGLDLALACDYRLAVATPTTTLGFPELKHGLLNPWGGITRLVRLVGAAAAVDVLTSPALTAREAHRLGLVDDAFSERRANTELRTFLSRTLRKRCRWHSPFKGWVARRVVAAYQPLIANTPHPALAEAMMLVPVAAESELAGLAAERSLFARVAFNTHAQATFALRQDELDGSVEPALPATIAVIGPVVPVADLLVESLLRGSRIAECAVDDSLQANAIESELIIAVKRGRVTPLEADQARSRIQRCEARADVVLLTSESAAALELAESLAKPAAPILAVNVDLAATIELSSRPRNLAGLNPHGELTEIVTLGACVNRARAWLQAIDITAMVACNHSIVKPLLVAWWDEAVRLVADGLPIDLVDKAAKALGAASGPLETLDGVGLDAAASQVPRVKPLVAAGIHGRPHREGFYVLAEDNPTCANAVAQLVLLEAAASAAPKRIAEPVSEEQARHLCERRLQGRLLVAACKRMAKGATAAELDRAIVRGLGLFTRFGGLLRFVDRQGVANAVADLKWLRRRFGERFTPPRVLREREEPFEHTPLKRSA